MDTTTTTNSQVYTIWQWCCNAYLQHGQRRLSFPRDTDPTKTYQWRYMEALRSKFKEWEFDDRMSKDFIEIAVQYANKNHLLNKGPSIFMQKNLLEVCYNELKNREKSVDGMINIINRANTWLHNQVGDKPLLNVLLRCESLGSYPNIIKWYKSSHLPEQYLALSQSCGLAMATLAKTKPDERSLLPNNARLFMLRMAILNNTAIKFQIRSILHNDWRKAV